MFLWRRTEGDQSPPLQQKPMQGPVYGFEAKLEREDTEMKAEEEGEEWEDDLEFYSSIEQCK